MKRLLLRVSALGVVVILGVIAIAQAQRGAEEPDPPSFEVADTGATASGNTAFETNRLTQPRVVLPASAPAPPPQALPGEASGHPLRELAFGPDPTGLTPPAIPGRSAPAAGVSDPRTSATPRYTQLPAFPGSQTPVDNASTARPTTPLPVTAGAPIRNLANSAAPGLLPNTGASRMPATGTTTAATGTAAHLPGPLFRPGVSPAGGRSLPEANPYAGAGSSDPAALDGRAALRPSTELRPPTFPANEGAARPGGKHLEGPQSPQLTIEKTAPAEVQVGKAATFRVVVRNTGTIAAAGVQIHDRIPQGTRLISTTPQATRDAQGGLVWNLGSLDPGREAAVEIELMPTAEGEIGSVATVSIVAEAAARTVATKPELVLQASVPERVLIGEEVALSITVSNPGSGVATNVVLDEQIPTGLQHPAGADLEYRVGDLPPGESRTLKLTLKASRPGLTTNVLKVRADGNLQASQESQIQVVAPKIDVAVAGPRRRYLEREASYQLSVRNPGTAPAKAVELVAYLPSGLKFVRANASGYYDEANRAVFWRLTELPVNETGTVELVTMPVEEGQQSLRLRGSADRADAAEQEQPVLIEGISAVLFEAVDASDPVEVGGQTTYEIRVLNQGSRAATNVRLAVQLPAELRPLSAEGPTRESIQGNQVVFDSLPRLAAKESTAYRVRVEALRPGDLRTSVQLMTDDMQSPVIKQESTKVYSDQ